MAESRRWRQDGMAASEARGADLRFAFLPIAAMSPTG